MRILFVHEVNYLTKVLFEMHEFPELLSLRGHEVSFLHFPERDRSPSSIRTRPSLRTRVATRSGRAYPNGRVSLVTPPTMGGVSLERYLAPVANVPTIRRLLSHGRFDVVVVYSVPTTGWQTVALAGRYGVPCVFRALDVSHSLRQTRLTRLIRRAEGYVYRNADVVSANNPALAAYCVRHGADPETTRVDLPPVDTTHLAPGPADPELQRRYGLHPDDRIVLFMGTLYRFAGLEGLLASSAPTLREDRRMKIVLVGDGEAAERLRRLSSDLGIQDQVVMTGRVPYDALPAHIRLGHVAVNPFEKQLTTDCALPHKVLQYMASGVATVSTSLDGLRGVIGQSAGVLLVDRPENVAGRAIHLLRDEAERARRAQQQRAFIEQTFDLDGIVSGFEDALAETITRRRARNTPLVTAGRVL